MVSQVVTGLPRVESITDRSAAGSALGLWGVAAVQHHDGSAADDLKAPGPFHGGEAGADRIVRDMPAPAAQGLDDGQGHGGVMELMPAQQGQTQAGEAGPVEHLAVQRMGDGAEGMKVRHGQRNAGTAAAGGHHLLH